MIKLISIVSSNGVIGVDNMLPFSYDADMRYFRKQTINCPVIMGRKTYESMGKPLAKRRNIIVSSAKDVPDLEIYPTLEEAINVVKDKYETIWLIGGSQIYQAGMQYADEIHLNIATKETFSDKNSVRFPWINPTIFHLSKMEQLVPGDDALINCIYTR